MDGQKKPRQHRLVIYSKAHTHQIRQTACKNDFVNADIISGSTIFLKIIFSPPFSGQARRVSAGFQTAPIATGTWISIPCARQSILYGGHQPSAIRVMVTANPRGVRLRAETRPLQVSIQVFTMARPRPTPPESRFLDGSGRKKGSKS